MRVARDRSGVVSTGQVDGRHQHSPLFDLGPAGHLTGSIQHVDRRRNTLFVAVTVVRHDRRDSSAHRPLARDKRPVPVNQGGVPDRHPGYVGDRIPLPGWQQPGRNAELAQTWSRSDVTPADF